MDTSSELSEAVHRDARPTDVTLTPQDEGLRALLDEISRLQTAVNNWMFPQERVFGIGVALVVGGLTVGLTNGHRVVLTVVPLVLVVFYGYMIQVTVEMLSRAGHKRCLEEAANRALRQNVFLEEEYVSPTRHGKHKVGRPGLFLYHVLLALLLVFATCVGWDAARSISIGVHLLYLAAIALSIGMLAASFIEMGRAYQRGYDAASVGSLSPPDTTRRPKTPLLSRAG